MLEVNIIQPSQISFSSPVVMVTKKDGSWHMCPDYRKLKKITIKDKFRIPIDLGGYRWTTTFSNWLKTVFWQFWQFTIFSRF
jgi:hypothetical protein